MAQNGLILCGGGAKGCFEVGALEYLYERGFFASVIAAASAGAVNATQLAAGGLPDTQAAKLQQLKDIWLNELRTSDDFYEEADWLKGADQAVRNAMALFHGPRFSNWPFSPWYLPPVAPILFGFLASDAVTVYDTVTKAGNHKSFFTLKAEDLMRRYVNPDEVRRSGVKLRLATVALESGALRYVTEAGALHNRDDSQFLPAGTVDVIKGAIASASIPGAFEPTQIGDEWYVDGGVRENLPIEAALNLGADNVVAINLSVRNAAVSSFDSKGVLDVVSRCVLDLMLDEPIQMQVDKAKASRKNFWFITPRVQVHDTLMIHPGLIRINIDYGYMVAADTVADAPQLISETIRTPGHTIIGSPPQINHGGHGHVTLPPAQTAPVFVTGPQNEALGTLADAITRLRMMTMPLESLADGTFEDIDQLTSQVGIGVQHAPSPDALRMVRAYKNLLLMLVSARKTLLGGSMPPGHDTWHLNWEQHRYDLSWASPWSECQYRSELVPAAIPETAMFVRSDTAPFEYYLLAPQRCRITSHALPRYYYGNVLDIPSVPEEIIMALPEGTPIS